MKETAGEKGANVNAPTPKTDELPEEISELAVHVLGSDAAAKLWLESPALALDGRRPCDLMGNESGEQLVRQLLMRIEYGVYS